MEYPIWLQVVLALSMSVSLMGLGAWMFCTSAAKAINAANKLEIKRANRETEALDNWKQAYDAEHAEHLQDVAELTDRIITLERTTGESEGGGSMRIKQKTIVEKMKPLYPALTQPIVSAVARGKAGVQYTNSFRRNAEERGIMFRRDRDGRVNPCPHKVRLTEAEDLSFRQYLEATGQTAQEFLHRAVTEALL